MTRLLALTASLAVVMHGSAQQATPVLRVVANDYAFMVASPAQSGVVRVRLVNHGHEMHHLELSPVPAEMSLRRFYDLATADQPSPLVHDVGGPDLTAPGDSSEITVEMAPGRYILTCWVNGTDGKPHMLRGMMAELRLGSSHAELSPPAAGVTVRATDYAFAIEGQLHSGTNIVRFENAGPQEHDIQVVRLAKGETVASIADWARRGGIGSPSRAVVGGSTGVDKNRHVWFTLSLTPGRYAMFCFVPDARDGKMHLLHGMLQEIIIRS